MIKTLLWDSKFFGFKVGEIELMEQPDWNSFEQDIATAITKYKLIYFITSEKLKIPKSILIKNNGKLINQRILFQKMLDESNFSPPIEIIHHDGKTQIPELIKLALVSGTYSRFKIDKDIPEGKFEELYTLWIKNSLSKQIADGIFVSTNQGKVTGMITYQNINKITNIGLVAVSESEQGKGIGKYLIKKVEEQAIEKGLTSIKVPTQSNNSGAFYFYKKLGFSLLEISNYYHFWIK